MTSWRDSILKEFSPNISRLTLVADPDGLLLEEGVLKGIREKGFELIPFEDHIAFRYAYESKYRGTWDKGIETDLVVVLHSSESDLDALPFDLLQAGRKLSFNLGDLFPKMSYPVVDALNRKDLDSLFAAQQQYTPERLSDNGTKDFILLHVFGIAPETIKKDSDLLQVLLRRHYKKQQIPEILNVRLIWTLKNTGQFNDWSLEEIVTDELAFYSFLQERWPLFLNRLLNIKNDTKTKVHFTGPEYLPFDHDDVKVYIDNLFLEGFLEPIDFQEAKLPGSSWAIVGIRHDADAGIKIRYDKLLKKVKEEIPPIDCTYIEWLTFATKFSELQKSSLSKDLSTENKDIVDELFTSIDDSFTKWLTGHYFHLYNQPPVPPAMVHHIPKALSRHIHENKIALIIIDGLSCMQWSILKDVLVQKDKSIAFKENNVFAWAPTLTSVSRQALLAGKAPLYFPDTIHTTARESRLWSQYWDSHNLKPNNVSFLKNLGSEPVEDTIGQTAIRSIRAVALIINTIDDIMHGSVLGQQGMAGQIQLWAENGYLSKMIGGLLNHDFKVFITSDHGNIEATGTGRPSEGILAETKGERARVFSSQTLRNRLKEKLPESIEWPSNGLPEKYFPLLAAGNSAFINKGEKSICHGSISISELIVPFVEVLRRKT
ncbi:BREX-3 system phosphatase PglZ [Fibrobacterota bacterium]